MRAGRHPAGFVRLCGRGVIVPVALIINSCALRLAGSAAAEWKEGIASHTHTLEPKALLRRSSSR